MTSGKFRWGSDQGEGSVVDGVKNWEIATDHTGRYVRPILRASNAAEHNIEETSLLLLQLRHGILFTKGGGPNGCWESRAAFG